MKAQGVQPDHAGGPENAAGGCRRRGGGRGPQRLGPTQAELTAYLDSDQGQGRGRGGAGRQAGLRAGEPRRRRPGRLTDEQVQCRFDETAANDPECAGHGAAAARGGARRRRAAQPPTDRLTAAQVDAAGRRVPRRATRRRCASTTPGREHGQIRAFNNRTYDVAKAVPTVVLRNEDYGRIARIIADGTPVELEFNIVNTYYPEGKTSYNTVAEIPGTDKADEVVMLGGHLDSWHAATGATDNAIGCAIMMEAARILQAIGAKPRRTIRVALWSGEEEGLLGSHGLRRSSTSARPRARSRSSRSSTAT